MCSSSNYVDAVDLDPATGVVEDLQDYFVWEGGSGWVRDREALVQSNVSVVGSP